MSTAAKLFLPHGPLGAGVVAAAAASPLLLLSAVWASAVAAAGTVLLVVGLVPLLVVWPSSCSFYFVLWG